LPEEPDRRLDAHPLVREHFGEQLRKEQPDAWREGHRRLYEHLKASAKELPETIEEMRPLYAAVVHGCLAGMNQEALDSVYWKRIQRGDESFNSRKLGAFGTEVATLSAFFDPPWERLAPGLTDSDGAWVLNEVGYALRALGRLSDAAGLMRLSLEMGIAQQDWQAAARRAANLSELLQSHGDLGEALARARTSVDLADRSGDAGMRMITRTETAAVLHALGRSEEAAAQFEEAEQMQKERQPAYPRLYSVQGFQYCDLLLDQGRDAEVRERAALTIGWEAGRLLDVALDHLSLGRAHLLAAQRDPAADLTPAASHLTQAVDGLRRAGQQDNLPLGLLARAALHTHTRAFPLAHKDLAESLTLTTRCGFRLHLVDTHLAYTRLHLAESAPDRTAARSHLAAASSLIATTGYHRRDPALAALAAQIPPEASSADR
jgi:tetratricopeptide (TPR) repeat protein